MLYREVRGIKIMGQLKSKQVQIHREGKSRSGREGMERKSKLEHCVLYYQDQPLRYMPERSPSCFFCRSKAQHYALVRPSCLSEPSLRERQRMKNKVAVSKHYYPFSENQKR